MSGDSWSRQREFGALLLTTLITAGVYFRAFFSELVWDDFTILTQHVPLFAKLENLLFPPTDAFRFSDFYYRPVVNFSHLLDVLIGGDSVARVAHTSNILFHVCAVIAVWSLVRRLLAGRAAAPLAAAAAATLFAVHPIHTESVSWIAGRSDVLATLFAVISVRLALRWRDDERLVSLLLASLAYLAALLSKEVAIATPLLAAGVIGLDRAIALPQPDRQLRRWLGLAGAYLVPTALYFALREAAGLTYGDINPQPLIAQMIDGGRAASWYLAKLVLPTPQSSWVTREMLPDLPATAFVLGGVTAFLGWALWSRKQGRGDIALIGVVWLCATLGPSMAVAMRTIAATPVAERYLYLPSVAVALITGALLCVAYERGWQRIGTAGMAGLLIAAGYGTLVRSAVWTDDFQLWTDVANKAPAEGIGRAHLGTAWLKKGNAKNGLENYRIALNLRLEERERAIVLNNRGVVYSRQGYRQLAEADFAAAIRIQPDYGAPYFNLAKLLMDQAGQIRALGGPAEQRDALARRAANYYRKTVELDPDFHPGRWALARTLATLGGRSEEQAQLASAVSRYREALGELDELLARDPNAAERAEVTELRRILQDDLQRLAFAEGGP